MKSSTFTVILFLVLVVSTGAAAAAEGWIITTDYSTFGRIRSFRMDAPWSVSGDLATIPGDAVGRHHDGLVYVVGRGGASQLQVYDPTAGFALVHEFSLGAGRNPQDIAFDAQGEAYVSCYDEAVLLRVDVVAESVLATYSTAAFADADGLPETAWLVYLDDRLFIANQKLDRANWYAPTGAGSLLVFDTVAEQWVDADAARAGLQSIVLAGADPYTRLEIVEVGGTPRLRVGCVGFFGLADGGVDEVDPATLASLGYLVTEQEMGGDINAFVSTGARRVHALVSDASFNTSLRRWDQTSGQVTIVDSAAGFVHADVAWDGSFQVYLADRTLGAAGLRVFDAASNAELTTGVIPTGLPPFAFVMPEDGPVAATPGAGPGVLALSAPVPNPCNPMSRIDIFGEPGAAVRVGVYDLGGRRVRVESLRLGAGGRAEFTFDGRDGRGAPLATGIYRVVAQDHGGFAARSVTLLK